MNEHEHHSNIQCESVLRYDDPGKHTATKMLLFEMALTYETYTRTHEKKKNSE